MKQYIFGHVKFIAVILSIPIWLNAGASCAKANASEAKIKIAIIDSGYKADLIKSGPRLKLCKTGHFDFTTGKAEIGYTEPHGTYIASILAKELENVDYCAIIYNVLSAHPRAMITENVVSAFYKASYEGLAAINASYAGYIISVAEREAVRDAAKRVDRIFVAAGNNGQNLDYECDAFPACFEISNMVAVGAFNADNIHRLKSSNYGGKVKSWFNGEYDSENEGTSFAAPRALASYIHQLEQILRTK